jgi:hypothetical protein
MLKDKFVHLVLHQRPIKQHVVVESKDMIKGADEFAAGRILGTHYIERPVWVPFRNCGY